MRRPSREEVLGRFRRITEAKYQDADETICCCGETLGEGGSLCRHGGCMSQKDWTIYQTVLNFQKKQETRNEST